MRTWKFFAHPMGQDMYYWLDTVGLQFSERPFHEDALAAELPFLASGRGTSLAEAAWVLLHELDLGAASEDQIEIWSTAKRRPILRGSLGRTACVYDRAVLGCEPAVAPLPGDLLFLLGVV